MATNNNCVGCGCGSSIPEPCVTPPPVCPNPQPCTEIVNAECVIYTGPAITCSDSPVIPTNSSIAEALDALVDYFCYGSCCTIPAVTQIDNPDYLLFCTDSTATCDYDGKLYNWYAINAATVGDGRIAGGIVNIDPLDNPINTWRVPNVNDWYALALALDATATQTPWVNASGGKIKTTTCWSNPNSAATNTSGLSVMPSVYRLDTGVFSTNNGQLGTYWGYNEASATTAPYYSLSYNDDTLLTSNFDKNYGLRLRLVRPIDCNETDGDFISNAYKDNDGNLYNAEVIGNLVWLTTDLIDTKFNNNALIPNLIINAAWATALTGAWCYPNNNLSYQIVYVNGCVEVKIAFEDFLNFIPTSAEVFIVEAGPGIQVDVDVIGAQTTYTVTNTDPGSAVTLASAGGTQTLVNDGVGPALVTKGLTAGTGISLSSTATEVTITNSAPDQVVALTPGTSIGITGTYPNFTINNSAPDQTVVLTAGTGIAVTGTYPNFNIINTGGGGGGSLRYNQALPPLGVGPVVIAHNLNTPFIIVSFHVNTSGLLVQGTDYTYNIIDNNTISVIPLSVGMQTFSVLITVLA